MCIRSQLKQYMVDNFYCLKANKTSFAMFRVLKESWRQKKCRAPGSKTVKIGLHLVTSSISSGCMAKISGLLPPPPPPLPLIPSHLTNLILRLGSLFMFLSLAPVDIKKRDGRNEVEMPHECLSKGNNCPGDLIKKGHLFVTFTLLIFFTSK